ncbi:hypothetical protein L1077_18115 [Pseudoalteromonas luteoviolacea]|uniref:hypothetical protein n=1 Tax=Pseudoalteromonas luteoviolacea TaxID=43657 RepID=UPI001F2BD247|nr:hypothetical protein [Pseudoalteromonas luteoviolacea]MCF6441355.1 hypothetical protein [Pseudoalteromonas luteoviolacea]
MSKLKLVFFTMIFMFAGAASAWTIIPSGVVDNCEWRFVRAYQAPGVSIFVYRAASSCQYRTKIIDYRVREKRYH